MTFAQRPRFGVEIETTHALRSNEFVIAMNEVGLVCESERYNHQTRDYWKLTTDSSCGWELVSPPLYWEDRHSIREVMRLLKAAGAEVDRNCGFHVHHEWPWQDHLMGNERTARLAQVVKLYEQTEPLLRVLIPGTRFWKRGVDPSSDPNTGDAPWARRYCKWNEGQVREGDKYVAVNVTPMEGGRPTIEFRQHQGTLNPTKALAWMELTRQIVYAASLPDDLLKAPSRVEQVFGTVSDPAWVYFNERAAEANVVMADVIEAILNPPTEEGPARDERGRFREETYPLITNSTTDSTGNITITFNDSPEEEN